MDRARFRYQTAISRCVAASTSQGGFVDFPRVIKRTLAQVLTEEHSVHGVYVANVVIDGTIDSPGIRALTKNVAAT